MAAVAAVAGQMAGLSITDTNTRHPHDPNWYAKMHKTGDLGVGLTASVGCFVVNNIPTQARKTFAIRRVCLTKAEPGEDDCILEDEDKLKALLDELLLHREISDHCCIVPLYAWTVALMQGELYLVTALKLAQFDNNNQSLNDITVDYRPDANDPVQGLPVALRRHLRMWTLEIAEGTEYLHGKRICHMDLHPGNVLVDRDAANPDIMHVRIADFGDSRRFGEAGQDKKKFVEEKAKDIQRIALLYVYGISGFWNKEANAIPVDVRDKIFKPKGATESDDDWAVKRYERTFVFGVLNYPADVIEARMIKCYQHFQVTLASAPYMNGQPKWATDLPVGHPFRPGPRMPTLWQRLSAGKGDVRVREYIWDEFQYIEAEAHCTARILPTLCPVGIACRPRQANQPRVDDCPSGSLYNEDNFKLHAHQGRNAVSVTATALTVAEEDKKIFELTRRAWPAGKRNLIFSSEVKQCKEEHWTDIQIAKVNEWESSFRFRCNQCDMWNQKHPDLFRHLADIVDHKRYRKGQCEPWIDLVNHSLTLQDLNTQDVGGHLAENGATWITPSLEEIRKRCDDLTE